MHGKPRLHRQDLILFIILFSLISFLTVSLFKSGFATLDLRVSFWVATIQTSFFTSIAIVIHYALDPLVMIVVSLLVAAYLFYRNSKTNSVLLLGAMALTALLVGVTKVLVYFPRPANALILVEGSSFPSGHTCVSIVFFGLLVYFGWKYWKSARTRTSLIILLVAVTSIIGFSRIYLNVHWFSDVIGGYTLGIFCLLFSLMTVQYLRGKIRR